MKLIYRDSSVLFDYMFYCMCFFLVWVFYLTSNEFICSVFFKWNKLLLILKWVQLGFPHSIFPEMGSYLRVIIYLLHFALELGVYVCLLITWSKLHALLKIAITFITVKNVTNFNFSETIITKCKLLSLYCTQKTDNTWLI